MISQYSKRSATCESVTLNSARKGNETMIFWFFRKVGDMWLMFDVRHVAGEAGVKVLPEYMDPAEFRAFANSPVMFEELLQRDLQRAADWCFKIDPDGAITRKVAI